MSRESIQKSHDRPLLNLRIDLIQNWYRSWIRSLATLLETDFLWTLRFGWKSVRDGPTNVYFKSMNWLSAITQPPSIWISAKAWRSIQASMISSKYWEFKINQISAHDNVHWSWVFYQDLLWVCLDWPVEIIHFICKIQNSTEIWMKIRSLRVTCEFPPKELQIEAKICLLEQ